MVTDDSLAVQASDEDNKELYVYNDHLGSLDAITDVNGTVVQRLGFDPWGQRRDPDNWQANYNLMESVYASILAEAKANTTRGFTGHEMLDEVGIIHMNGRIYDPIIARFVQADPIIQAAANTQSLNRYAYVWNNPLNATDPSGYQVRWNHVQKGFRQAVGIVIGVVAAFQCGPTCGWQAYAAIGAFTSAVSAAINGADGMGILTAAITGGITGGVGDAVKGLDLWMKVGTMAVVGGVTSLISGGNFGNGFLAGGIGTYAGSTKWIPDGNTAIRVGVGAIVGGTVSRASGGKFANGAATGAFSAAFSEGLSRFSGGNEEPLPSAEKVNEIEQRILNSGKNMSKGEVMKRVTFVDRKGRALKATKYRQAMEQVLDTDAGLALASSYLSGAPDGVMLEVRIIPGRGSAVGAQGGMRIDSTEINGGFTKNDFNYFKATESGVYIKQTLTRTIAHELYHATSSFSKSSEINAVIAENLIMGQVNPNAGVRNGYNRSISRFQLPANARIVE